MKPTVKTTRLTGYSWDIADSKAGVGSRQQRKWLKHITARTARQTIKRLARLELLEES